MHQECTCCPTQQRELRSAPDTPVAELRHPADSRKFPPPRHRPVAAITTCTPITMQVMLTVITNMKYSVFKSLRGEKKN